MLVASETCALDLVRAEYVREVEPGEVIVIDDDGMRSIRPFAPAPAETLRFRVRLFRAARQPALWAQRLSGAQTAGTRAGAGMSGGCGYRRAGTGLRQCRSAGICRGIGAAVRNGAGAQPLRRPHVYRAAPVDSPFRRQDQIQSGRGITQRKEDRTGRGFAGSRHHLAQGHSDAAAGGRARSPYANRGATYDQFVFLWNRHADARGTARLSSIGRGDPQAISPPIRWVT